MFSLESHRESYCFIELNKGKVVKEVNILKLVYLSGNWIVLKKKKKKDHSPSLVYKESAIASLVVSILPSEAHGKKSSAAKLPGNQRTMFLNGAN